MRTKNIVQKMLDFLEKAPSEKEYSVWGILRKLYPLRSFTTDELFKINRNFRELAKERNLFLDSKNYNRIPVGLPYCICFVVRKLVTMEELEGKLNNVSDSYPEFVRDILEDCEIHKEKDENLKENVFYYMVEHPNADTSDILDFEMNCIGIPWGDDDGKWYRWGFQITEEEAKRITQEEYCAD